MPLTEGHLTAKFGGYWHCGSGDTFHLSSGLTLKVSHYPAKFGGLKHYGSGDVFGG